jgi:hypothetical protein
MRGNHLGRGESKKKKKKKKKGGKAKNGQLLAKATLSFYFSPPLFSHLYD